jgi:hypothetical protein
MAKRTSGQKILEDSAGGGGINWKELLVDLKPDKQTGKTTKKLRLIGFPIEFREATAYKRSEDGKSRVAVPFPDAHLNKGFTRVCDDDLENDIWVQMGYVTTKRYAINVLDRDDGGKGSCKG